MDKCDKIGVFFVVLGILGACSGFLCLLLAISGAVAPAFWFTIVIVGGVLAG
jgi:hypothetical protein